jgi:hypothetical protein
VPRDSTSTKQKQQQKYIILRQSFQEGITVRAPMMMSPTVGRSQDFHPQSRSSNHQPSTRARRRSVEIARLCKCFHQSVQALCGSRIYQYHLSSWRIFADGYSWRRKLELHDVPYSHASSHCRTTFDGQQ